MALSGIGKHVKLAVFCMVVFALPVFAYYANCSLPLLRLIGGGSFQFGLWGDMPYAKNHDEPKMPALIGDMNAAGLAFTVYDGDTKDGSSPCDDSAVGEQPALLFNQTEAPTVYVPGDNEWTDCHRLSNGGYDALERLSFIRRQLFNTGQSFGKNKLKLEHQGPLGGPYSENTRWVYRRVVFVGLNVPGSNNGKVDPARCLSLANSARTEEQCEADNWEYQDRNKNNREWLADSFRLAKESQAPGVMVAIQADPGFDLPETEHIDERTLPEFDGYTGFLEELEAQTQAFAGQVVLVHGDTHFFKVDKPLFKQSHLLRNLTRVETFGSPNIHWVKVTVDPLSRNVFSFEPMIVKGN